MTANLIEGIKNKAVGNYFPANKTSKSSDQEALALQWKSQHLMYIVTWIYIVLARRTFLFTTCFIEILD